MTALLLLSAALSAEPDNSVTLLVCYDQSEACKAMFPVLAKVKEAGYHIVYMNVDRPENQTQLGLLKYDKAKPMPFCVMWVGHEALEECCGSLSYEGVIAWFNRTAKGEPSPGKIIKATAQKEYLKNAPENLVYLRQRMGPSTCPMLGCPIHSRVISEYVDANGNVVPAPTQPGCPGGNCPGGKCPK